jgi:exonuclease III
MIIISLNVRGLGGSYKKMSPKRLMIAQYKPKIILIQETMCERRKVEGILSSFLKHWNFPSLDSNGKYEGLVIGCNNSLSLTSSYVFNAILFIELWSMELGKTFSVINMDGPYEDKKPLWDKLFS